MSKDGLTYAQSGVDIAAGNEFVKAIKPFAKSTARTGANSQLGGFGGLFDLKECGFSDPILVAANDGVGTKVKIAIEFDKHDTIGIDLVAMSINDLIVQGAEPLFFLDYLATSKLDLETGASIVSGIAEGCRQSEAALIGGETAEMPDLYDQKDYDLAGFAVGAVERDRMLPKSDELANGDIIIGMTSSGIHSNGFSLVRKLVKNLSLSWDQQAPFNSEDTLGEALLTPTLIYVKALKPLIKNTQSIKALAHITGGGLIENIPRVLPEHLSAEIDLNSLKIHDVFKWLSKEGNISDTEMLRTFNCGIGMIAIVSENNLDETLGQLNKSAETAYVIGKLTDGISEKQSVKFSGTPSFT